MATKPKSKKPVVVVDIDGVLFDTPVDAVATANRLHGTKHLATDIFNHNAEHDKTKFVVNGKDLFHAFQHDTAQYRQVEGAKAALKRLSHRANIIALTSRSYDLFYTLTRKVIAEHFGDIISEVYFTTAPNSDQHREKGEIVKELGGNVLVDDAVKYCLSARAYGIPAVLIAQPYNKAGHDYPPEYCAANWQEVVQIVERELDILAR